MGWLLEKSCASCSQIPSPADAAAAGAGAAAAAADSAPEPPLVKVADGAAELYADLFGGGGSDGSGGVLLKTQVAEVGDGGR